VKVFVCSVKKTTVEEAVMYVEVPTQKMAKECDWLIWSESVYDTWEDYKETTVKHEVLSASEIRSRCDVPETDLEIVPYNNPNFEPKEVKTLAELLRPKSRSKMDDNSAHITRNIQMLERQMAETTKQIAEFKSMLAKRESKKGV
jgi:hypothetical protein